MMKVWGLTDIGLVRSENQDAYAVRTSQESGHLVCVVCDGMGGPRGGSLASTLAAETFLDSCLANLQPGMGPQEVQLVAEFAAGAANSAVYRRSLEDPRLRGMGTTLVSAITWEDQALVSNVGDSRAYLIRPDGSMEPAGIRRITKDHSLVERLVDMGNITAEEARVHPNRNVITRALGPDEETCSDSYLVRLHPGDCILLCTDGLTGMATDQEIERTILSLENKNDCLERLLDLAMRRGAADNVTAVLLQQQ